MGSDNLFHKRKAKKVTQLQRAKESREPYDKVLIVCEGEKTEPHYLIALRDHLKLSQAKIKIDSKSDSDPLKVVNYAKRLIEASRNDPYDHVFCVIDRDKHANYDRAIAQVDRYKNKDAQLHAIVSNPCFEFWLLLHFAYTTKQFGTSGGSPCDDLIKKDLKKHIKDYKKGDRSIISSINIEPKLETAVENAKRANKTAKENGTDNPTTQMDKLVDYLKGLKDRVQRKPLKL